MRPITTFFSAAFCICAVHAQYAIPQVLKRVELPFMDHGAVADLNGDGEKDLVVCGASDGVGRVGLYFNDGAENFGDMILLDSAGYQHEIAVLPADLDNDGDQDLFVIEQYTRVLFFTNDGSGSFGPPVQVLDSFGEQRGLAVRDIDGDGILDLVMADYWSDSINWYKGVGDGSLLAAQTVAVDMPWLADIAVGDIDGDGDEDVAVASHEGDHYWCANNGLGVFATPTSLGDAGDNSYDVKLADLDGDGDLDMIGQSFYMVDKSCWWRNNGGGQFGSEELIADTRVWSNEIADMDGDGDLDVVPWCEDARDWYENDGSGQFIAAHHVSDAQLGQVELLDMDSDGDVDVVELERSTSWITNDGGGSMGERKIICTELDLADQFEVLDLDADGDLDIVSDYQQFGQRMVYYLNNGDGTYGIQQILVDSLFFGTQVREAA